MPETEGPPQGLPQLVAAFLADPTQQQPLAHAILQLITAADPAATLLLSSALHQLLAAQLHPSSDSRAQPQQLATFLHQALFQPTTDDPSPDRKAALADSFIDTVWQLDQEVEVLVPLLVAQHLAAQPSSTEQQQDGMQVDGAQADEAKDIPTQVAAGRKRLGQVVKQLVDAGDLPQQAVLERLDYTILGELGILHDTKVFSRQEVRSRTALYYKQQKFNLLREESEGFSKLVVELLSNLGPAHSSQDGRSQESEAQRKKRAVSANDKVKNLIGNFDLDPSRTLDVFLDTFADNVVDHYQFFLDFLAVSPWAPKNGAGAAGREKDEKGKGKEKEKVDVGVEEDGGSSMIAQILGFKFVYYQGQDAPETPENLFLATALLIWHGYVKLTDIWAHLSPTDDDLVKLKAKWEEEQAAAARSVGGGNALALAGALADDEAPPAGAPSSSAPAASSSSSAAAPPPPPREPPNQKLALLRALLTLGDVPHALFLLAQFPFLPSAFPDLADLLNRLLAVSIAPAYESISVAAKEGGQWKDEMSAPRPKVTVDLAKGGERKVSLPVRKPVLTAQAFPDPRGEWTFFFPLWRERVPRAGDWEEVLQLLEGVWVPLIRVGLARDFGLYTRVLRIIAADLSPSPDDHPRRQRWLDLLRVHLLPAVSLLSSSTAAALELWRVLSLFPIETRFELYGEWKAFAYRRIPSLGVRKAEAERDTKGVLRRLSIDNVKKLGKVLSRVAHTNPTVVFAVALNQAMNYENLVNPIVESVRYLTELGYDVLAYSILDALSSDRPKMKEDGTSIAMWLQGLAGFTGQVYRRWGPMQSSLWVVLQYLTNQLVLGNSKDLVVLRDLVVRMTGLEPFADLSDAQVQSLAGGRRLRNEVFNMTEIKHAGMRAQLEAVNKSRGRLSEALLGKGLAMPLLVNVALQRQACLKGDAHLKSLGAFFDQNHAILFQLTELLGSLTTPDELAALVPPVEQLLAEYKLDAGVAFDIARPKLRKALKDGDDADTAAYEKEQAAKRRALAAKLQRAKEESSASPAPASAAKKDKEEEGGDVKMEEAGESGTPPPPSSLAAAEGKKVEENGDVAMGEAGTPPAAAAAVAAEAVEASSVEPVNPWHPGLVEVIENVAEELPRDARERLGAPFFVTFWQLTLYDLLYPKKRYDTEIERLKHLQREAATLGNVKPDERDKFISKVVQLAVGLQEEAAKHLAARNVVARRLTRESKHWFVDGGKVKVKADRQRLADDILQYCLLPRARLSLPDAVFAHQMIRKLHSLNAPGFHTVVLYDRLLTSQVGPVIFSCTENEARNYARFLYDVLGDLFRWHKDKAAYEDEAIGASSSQTGQLQGFARVYVAENAKKAGKPNYLSHEDFQGILLKWHYRMITGFIESFQSGEYMHIKNSILVLTKIAPYFPLDHNQGEKLEQAVVELLAAEKREDLTILAQGYKAVINKSRKTWINKPKKEAAKPSPAPAAAAHKAAAASSTAKSASPAAPAKPAASSAAAPSASSRLPPTGPSSSSSVPTGPKLPTRPSANGRTSDQDVKPSTSSSSSSVVPTKPSDSSSSRRTETNGAPSSRADADKLRAEALASMRASAANSPANGTSSNASATKAMDPPPAPSASSRGGALPDRPGSRANSRAATPPRSSAASDRDRERERDSDRDRRGGGRDGRDARDRDARDSRDSRDTRSARDDDRSSRRASPARSVESSHSGRGGRDGRDVRDSRDARDARDSRDSRSARDARDARDAREAREARDARDARDREAREREREKEKERDRRDPPRGSSGRGGGRDDRDRDARSDRSGGRDRDERDRRDEPRSSRRAEDDRYKSTSSSSSSARREDDRRRVDEPNSGSSSSRRTSDKQLRLSRAEEEREAEKEKQRQRDQEREEQREKERAEQKRADFKRREEDARRASGRGGRDEPSRSSSSAPPPRNGLPAKPTDPSGTTGGDRLRPAPADRSKSKEEQKNPELYERARASLPGQASPPAPASAPALKADSPSRGGGGGDEGLSIKGRGRLFAGALAGTRSGSGSGSGEESSRKRSSNSLADRLGGAPEEKRPRTEDSGRSGGGGGRDGGGRRRR
ncbi:hypothetical protein JCM8097_006959 [Rhodosporidiobolus ruineniae]